MDVQILAAAVIGLVVGAAVAWWFGRALLGARLDERLRSHDIELARLRDDVAREQKAVENAEAQTVAERERGEARLHESIQARDSLRRENEALSKQLAIAATREEERARESATREALLTQAKEILSHEFKAVSSDLLDQKAKHLNEQQSDQLKLLLTPFRDQVEQFQKEVRTAKEQELAGRVELKGELKQLRDLNQNLSQEAHALTQALRGDSKKRGNWGELVLQRLLEVAGLREGREFELQRAIEGVDRQRQFPDVIVRLSSDRSLVIDSKVSLLAFEQLTQTESDDDRERFRREHRSALRTHIEQLGGKRYAESPELHSPEFVVLFVPIEAAYLEAVGDDGSLHELAISRKVVLASPGMLLGLLRIVSELWRVDERQNNAEQIARQAGALYDSFVRVAENLQLTLGRLDGARDELSMAIKRMNSGRGNMVSQMEKLRDMGARTSKTMPPKLLLEATGDDVDLPDDSLPP